MNLAEKNQSRNSFWMPPEWHEKQRTFMEWPARRAIWDIGIDQAKKAYANVANAISEFEPLTMIINKGEEREAEKLLSSQVDLIEIPHDDSWFRDNGPTFIFHEKKLSAVYWKFNAWGEKFLPYDKDAGVASKLLDHLNVKGDKADIVMEGGSFHVDGCGTLLTTKECLLNPNRNKNLSQSQIESELSRFLGVENFIWLNRGVFGDEDTDGHVDNMACFVNESMIVIQSSYDSNDDNYPRFNENLGILRRVNSHLSKKYEIVEIEQPPARFIGEKRLALSYINYYPVNGGIILPVFGDEAKKYDRNAEAKLREYYPGRKIVPIDGSAIITGGGNIHCITQQMPKV